MVVYCSGRLNFVSLECSTVMLVTRCSSLERKYVTGDAATTAKTPIDLEVLFSVGGAWIKAGGL